MEKLLFSLLIAGCSLNAAASETVSIYQVLGNPSYFNARQVTVSGVLGVLDGDIVVLFPDSERKSNDILIDSMVLSGAMRTEPSGNSTRMKCRSWTENL